MPKTTRVSLLQQLGSKQDSVAWSRFVELYTPLVYRWVADLGIRDSERNDVVQDVANELGISVNAVYLARGRVLQRLRHELNGLWE